MDFWQDKDDEYRFKMTDVYNEQIQDLAKILPTFKVANATIHFDETSPHMHVVGVPVIENCKSPSPLAPSPRGSSGARAASVASPPRPAFPARPAPRARAPTWLILPVAYACLKD